MGSPFELLQRAIGWHWSDVDADPFIPEGTRIYAVGDIHGRVDLLEDLHERIIIDSKIAPFKTKKVIIYLGDYIDRGHHSKDVIELLVTVQLDGFESIRLKGNHEDSILRFLEDYSFGSTWFSFGGDATAFSYGVRVPSGFKSQDDFKFIRQELSRLMPHRHLDFLAKLKLMSVIGSYIFVHAGIRSNRSLHKQVPEDLLWIRDEFLESEGVPGKVIVHGHSLRHRPDVQNHRIGIDTGAYATNILTCLVLEGTTRRFIDTFPSGS